MRDDDHTRSLRVRIQRFSGMGTHFHVSLKPDPVVPDVPAERTMKFRKRETAVRWVNDAFERDYARAGYELVWDEGEQQQWFYGEGD
ncbi:MAG: hypothetical protein EA383_04465 [Spirochaetaceae bacterium]|nr:MAG: hypothetical protein EA383_04465 [Spirochaetaceae bacterium]